jgi:tRNA modification GTPase
MLSTDDRSIIAQCTPQGIGALALLRLSGTDAVTIADTMSSLNGGKKLASQATHTIHYGKIMGANNEIIDTVLFLLMRGPKTFTGQDTVEITCHNNPFIIEAIISQALAHGARMAQPGEFTRRAVVNNKIDLIQAEAINDLIHAQSQEGLKRSLSQLEGSLSHTISAIERQLIQALALSEASFEFLDEESLEFSAQIQKIIDNIRTQIAEIRSSHAHHKQIRQGIRIALIGSVNAGKSSLFNALVGSNRAIVTDQAGTTRDIIEAGLYVEGLYWTLIDTAGLRKADDHIEQEGIRRSYQEAEQADIILLVQDSSRPLSEEEREVYQALTDQHASKVISILSKTDLALADQDCPATMLKLSVTENACISELKHHIQHKIKALFKTDGSSFLLTQRQHNLLLSLDRLLEEIEGMFPEQCHFELLSHRLNEALSELCELSGKTISDKATDAVFREFCVGK